MLRKKLRGAEAEELAGLPTGLTLSAMYLSIRRPLGSANFYDFKRFASKTVWNSLFLVDVASATLVNFHSLSESHGV